MAKFQLYVTRIALRYGILGVPSISDPNFVSRVVFDDDQAGRAQVALRVPVPEQERGADPDPHAPGALGVRAPASRGDWCGRPRTRGCSGRGRGRPTWSAGVPVVSQALADAVQSSIVVLLIAAVLVMAATLTLVFRTRLRLLPLGLALAAAAVTFGALSLAGGSLTMASIAVLPVLIGLAVDYAIQFQARFDEQRSRRRRPAEAGDQRAAVVEDAVAAATAGGPTIVTAGAATAVGFLVLLLSPVPMVRGFGLLLVLGIVVALACAIVAGFAVLVRFGGRAEPRRGRVRERLAGIGAHPRVEAARERLADHSWRALGVALAQPRKVLAVGLAVAVLGLALDTQSEVVSDVQQLVPQDLQALRDVDELQNATGVSGEIDVAVRADDITRPAVLRWMTSFQSGVLRAHGYREGKRCTQAHDAPELCPALSLPTCSAPRAAISRGCASCCAHVPPYFSQGVITPDRRTANLAFGIRLMPLDRQKEVVDDIKRRLDPPDGVEAAVVGLPVLAAEANGALSSPLAPRADPARRAGGRVPRAPRGAALGARGRGAADPDRARHRLVGRRFSSSSACCPVRSRCS